MRSHKMENGGYTAVGVFRKHLSENSKKSKYATHGVTAEELASGEKESLMINRKKKAKVESEDEYQDVEESDDEMANVQQITQMAEKMTIGSK